MVTCAVEFKSWKKIKREKNELTWNKGWNRFKGTLLEWVMVDEVLLVVYQLRRTTRFELFDILKKMCLLGPSRVGQKYWKLCLTRPLPLKQSWINFDKKNSMESLNLSWSPLALCLIWNTKWSRNKVNSTV